MMVLSTSLSNMATLYSSLTLSAFLAIYLHKLLRRLSRKNAVHYYYFYRQPIARPQQPEKINSTTFKFDWHNCYDLSMQALPRPEDRLRERFQQETICLLGSKENLVMSCAWFAHNTYEEDEVWCQYDFSNSPETVWDYDIYIAEKYRLGRAFYRMWQAASLKLYGNGYRQTLSRISAYNPASISSHEKLGAVRCGFAIYVRLMSLQLMISDMQPYFHVTTSWEKRPVLNFS